MNQEILFPVAERFVSVNGEGLRAGRLAAFIRMTGCNLACSWCDTAWANDESCAHENLSAQQLVAWVSDTCVSCVTLTGGEPALQPGLGALIEALAQSDTWGNDTKRVIEIETNGSVDLAALHELRCSLKHIVSVPTTIAFTVDCKLPSSGMFSEMLESNYDLLESEDAVKFVVASKEDMEAAYDRIKAYSLCSTCEVLFSPVFSCIEPADIVVFMEEKQLSEVRLQLQLHKVIWPNVDKGV